MWWKRSIIGLTGIMFLWDRIATNKSGWSNNHYLTVIYLCYIKNLLKLTKLFININGKILGKYVKKTKKIIGYYNSSFSVYIMEIVYRFFWVEVLSING